MIFKSCNLDLHVLTPVLFSAVSLFSVAEEEVVAVAVPFCSCFMMFNL